MSNPYLNRRVLRARAHLGSATQRGVPESVLDDLRRELTAAKLARAIHEALEQTPALTAEQRADLALLLVGAE